MGRKDRVPSQGSTRSGAGGDPAPDARPTPTQRLPDDRPPAGHSWAGICHVSSSPVTPASPTPSSALAPALHTPAPTRRRRRWGRGEVALLGVLPRGAWARAPGCAHLSERQREMNNLGRPRGSCRPVLTAPRPLPRAGRSGRSGRESEASPSLPFVFLLGWVYFYDSFFPFLFFFLPFFPFFLLRRCVCVLSFRPGWGSAGCSCLLLTFHRKRGPGVGCAAPPGTKEQGVGRNPSYPRYQDWPTATQSGGRERERERGQAQRCPRPAQPTRLPVTRGHCLPHPRAIITR